MKIISDKYILIEKIGEGGQAEVYLAKLINTDFGLEKKVVIKFFPKNDHVKKYFMNEVKILSKMDHQNIVSILDAGETNEKYYLVIEYIKGKTLKEFCQSLRNKRILLDPNFLVSVAHKVFQALKYAHTSKSGAVLHSDISPQNIIIAEDGRAKLIDFGIAQITTDTSVPKSKGKVSYLPESVINGTRPYDESTDMYSLGESLERSIENANIESTDQVKYLIRALKEFDGSYEKIEELFKNQLQNFQGDSLPIIEKVFEDKFIVESTDVSVDEFKTNARYKSKKKIYISTFSILILATGIFLAIKKPWIDRDHFSSTFAFILNNDGNYKLIYPEKNVSNILASRESVVDKACELYCYDNTTYISGFHYKFSDWMEKDKGVKLMLEAYKKNVDGQKRFEFTFNTIITNVLNNYKEYEPQCKQVKSCEVFSNIKKEFDVELYYAKNNEEHVRSIYNILLGKNKHVDFLLSEWDKDFKSPKANEIYLSKKIFAETKKTKYAIYSTNLIMNADNCRIIGDYRYLGADTLFDTQGSKNAESFFNVLFVPNDAEVINLEGVPSIKFKSKNKTVCSYSRSRKNFKLSHLKIWEVK